jgi:hypothetical protein
MLQQHGILTSVLGAASIVKPTLPCSSSSSDVPLSSSMQDGIASITCVGRLCCAITFPASKLDVPNPQSITFVPLVLILTPFLCVLLPSCCLSLQCAE